MLPGPPSFLRIYLHTYGNKDGCVSILPTRLAIFALPSEMGEGSGFGEFQAYRLGVCATR